MDYEDLPKYVQERIDELIEEGMNEDDAWEQALREEYREDDDIPEPEDRDLFLENWSPRGW